MSSKQIYFHVTLHFTSLNIHLLLLLVSSVTFWGKSVSQLQVTLPRAVYIQASPATHFTASDHLLEECLLPDCLSLGCHSVIVLVYFMTSILASEPKSLFLRTSVQSCIWFQCFTHNLSKKCKQLIFIFFSGKLF